MIILTSKKRKYYPKAADFLYENLQIQRQNPTKNIEHLIFSYKEAILATYSLNLKQKARILAKQAYLISKNFNAEKYLKEDKPMDQLLEAQAQFKSYIQNSQQDLEPYQITSQKLHRKWKTIATQALWISKELSYIKT